MVAPARCPEPPLLDAALPDEKLAAALVHAYRGACLKVLKEKSWHFARGALTKSKYYPTLVAGARTLIEHEIPPTSWAAFSCDVWKRFNNTPSAAKRRQGKFPPVPWVFAPKRIEERRGWFRREAGDYGGGRLAVGPKHKDLLIRYQRMRLALLDEGTDVERVVRRYFPQGYAAAVAEARDEAARYQERFKKMVAEGVWVW